MSPGLSLLCFAFSDMRELEKAVILLVPNSAVNEKPKIQNKGNPVCSSVHVPVLTTMYASSV